MLAPESSFLLWYLRLSVELVCSGERHEHINDHEVVVNGADLRGVSRPNHARCENCNLLIRGYELGRFFEVANVRHGDHPLEGRGPEEDREGTRRVYQQAAHTTRPRQAHDHVL